MFGLQLISAVSLLGLFFLGNAYVLEYPNKVLGRLVQKKMDIQPEEYIELFCTLNITEEMLSNCTAENLAFYQEDRLVHFSNMSMLNRTTKQLRVKPNMTGLYYRYFCILEPKCLSANWISNGTSMMQPFMEWDENPKLYISHKDVSVDTVPKNVTDFSCKLHEFSKLKCQWWLENAPFTTSYELSFCTTNRSEARCANISCTLDCSYKNVNYLLGGGWTYCNGGVKLRGKSVFKKHQWECNLTSLPNSQQTFQNLELKLIGKNDYGNTTQIFPVAHIQPRVANLTEEAKTSTSICIKLFIAGMRFFFPTMQFKVEYRWTESTQWRNQSLFSALITESNEYVLVNVTDLPPNKNVTVRISAKAEENEDKFWSEPVQKIFRTNACRPYRPPEADVGSFEIQRVSDGRHVFVYWQPLSEDEFNGDNFHYEVEAFKHSDPNRRHLFEPNLLKNSYARFDMDSDAYSILIFSANKEGRSDFASEVRVPDEKNHVSVFKYIGIKILFIKSPKLYFRVLSNNVSNKTLKNFTVFQCNTETRRSNVPFACDRQLSWKQVKADQHELSINETRFWFAVSANMDQWSSGMQRESCMEKPTNEITVQIDFTGPTYINMSWYLHCGIYENPSNYFLKLYYCNALEQNSAESCASKNPPSKTIPLNTTNYQLKDLSFYTTYLIGIWLLRKSHPQLSTAPYSKQVTTKEGPPDVTGVKINISEVSNTAANLTWDKPKKINGILRYYQINYSSEQINHTSNETRFALNHASNETHFTLTDLKPYTWYKVTLKACTVHCSVEITSEQFMTKIGSPSSVTLEKQVRDTTITFHWQKPQIPNGPEPTYELIQIVKDNKKNQLWNQSFPSSSFDKTLEFNCTNDTIIYEFKVRAINEDRSPERNIIHQGPWSIPEVIDCSIYGLNSRVLVYIFISLLFLLFLGLFQTYVSYKNYFKPKIEAMKDISIHIPRLYKLPIDLSNSNKDKDRGSNSPCP